MLYPSFTDEEIEVQGGKVVCTHRGGRRGGYSRHSDPCLWDSRGYALFHFFLGKHFFSSYKK